jgi:histone acetyltransferase (RNA polymerase elongator complex component)
LNPYFEEFCTIKNIRSISGVLVITIFTSAYPKIRKKKQKFSCKHNCYYCPDESKKNGAEHDMPRSYLLWEPAVQRGFRNGWDAFRQMIDRLINLNLFGDR